MIPDQQFRFIVGALSNRLEIRRNSVLLPVAVASRFGPLSPAELFRHRERIFPLFASFRFLQRAAAALLIVSVSSGMMSFSNSLASEQASDNAS